jgi:glutamine synthetase
MATTTKKQHGGKRKNQKGQPRIFVPDGKVRKTVDLETEMAEEIEKLGFKISTFLREAGKGKLNQLRAIKERKTKAA